VGDAIASGEPFAEITRPFAFSRCPALGRGFRDKANYLRIAIPLAQCFSAYPKVRSVRQVQLGRSMQGWGQK
jgi:hypothetical protein